MSQLERAKSDLAGKEAELSALEIRVQQARDRVAELRATVKVLTGYEADITSGQAGIDMVPSPATDLTLQTPTAKVIGPESPFYGKSLGAAALAVLASEKEPLTAGYMVHVLREAGWNFTSRNPPLTLYWALRDVTNKTGEVVTIPGSKWALTSSRPNAAHVAKSVAGLVRARERGVALGAPRRMTDDMLIVMRRMLAEGRTIVKIAEILGVSKVTINRYRARDKELTDAEIENDTLELGPNVHRLSR